jgi:hypothetical protein
MISCIITRYNETIDWIQYIQNEVSVFYIYNKGSNDNLFKNYNPPENSVKVIKLPNIGRSDHTIAHHILENWDTLENTLVFLPASILMCNLKGYYLNCIRKNIQNINNFKGFYSPRFRKVSSKFNYSIVDYQPVGLLNKNDNPFIKSEFQDFQTWKKEVVDDRPIHYVTFRNTFIVNKENIKYISKEIYNNILKSVSVGDKLENGHFTERIWAHLFRQFSFDFTPFQ